MILGNVNLGSGPSAGNGDPLRTAFSIINENFAQINSNCGAISNSVTSVAGRTGTVTLTTQDIIGNNYLSLVILPAPLSSTSTGSFGQMVVSGTTLYICTAKNTWVKTTVTTTF